MPGRAGPAVTDPAAAAAAAAHAAAAAPPAPRPAARVDGAEGNAALAVAAVLLRTRLQQKQLFGIFVIDICWLLHFNFVLPGEHMLDKRHRRCSSCWPPTPPA